MMASDRNLGAYAHSPQFDRDAVRRANLPAGVNIRVSVAVIPRGNYFYRDKLGRWR